MEDEVRRSRRLAVVLGVLVAGGILAPAGGVGLHAAAGAQQSVDVASISGRVTDPSGAVVAGAQVAARHIHTNVTATTATDTEGRFRLPYLKIGPYEIA